MNKRTKFPSAKNSLELAELLNLDPEDGIEMEFRAQLNLKIVEIVKKKGLTHAEVAEMTRASRTRVTATLNGNTSAVSTDFLLRILYALGYRVKVSFPQAKIAA